VNESNDSDDAPAGDANSVRTIVLFDGLCHFCSGSVGFILRRDASRRFAFAPLQSSVAQELLKGFDRPSKDMDSLVLIEDGRVSTRSTAALKIVRQLSGMWPLLFILIVVPRPLRNMCYDLFARNRYRWFGKHDRCFVPSAEERERFLA
jgi:predicted DCC family thiol-disulfide oxidoreductase YuxK